MNSAPGVSLIVPCKNETENIEELVRRTPRFTGPLEIIFVDGRSNDGTREEILRVASLFPEKNISLVDQVDSHGKGPAVRLGFAKARHEVFIILDADLTIKPEDTTLFYEPFLSMPGGGKLVCGTRFAYPMEKKAMRFLNYWGNRFFSVVLSFLMRQKVTDTLCGTKAIHRKDYERIAANRAVFGEFDPFGDFDLLFGAAYLKLSIVEIKLSYLARKYGVTKIHRFRDGVLLLKMCWIAWSKLRQKPR